MANGNLPATITDAREEITRLHEAKIRQRRQDEERRERMDVAMFFAGTRLASQLLDTMFPQFATIKPIAEIGGGGFLLMRSLDPAEKRQGAMLGAALALLIGPLDKISSFFKETVAKFANKGKK